MRTCAPAAVMSGSSGPRSEPHASTRTRTSTPARARSASAAAKRVAISPWSKMYSSRLIDRRAPAIASSIDGKMPSPFSRRSTRLPSTISVPSASSERRNSSDSTG